jgi:hypothetical protein
MNNPAYREARMAGMIGENQSKQAKGKLDLEVLPTQSKEQIARNILNASDHEFKQTINQLDQAIVTMESNGAGAGVAQVLQQLPPSLQQMAAASGDPKGFLSSLRTKMVDIKSRTPDSAAKIREEEAKTAGNLAGITLNNTSQEKIAAGNNSTSIGVANINAASRLAAAQARNKETDILSQVKAGKLNYEKAATAFEIMASMTPDPEEAKKYAKLASAFSVADQKSKAAGRQVPVDLSAMGVATQQIVPSLGGASGSFAPGAEQQQTPTLAGKQRKPLSAF